MDIWHPLSTGIAIVFSGLTLWFSGNSYTFDDSRELCEVSTILSFISACATIVFFTIQLFTNISRPAVIPFFVAFLISLCTVGTKWYCYYLEQNTDLVRQTKILIILNGFFSLVLAGCNGYLTYLCAIIPDKKPANSGNSQV
jgi:hypothetical protein